MGNSDALAELWRSDPSEKVGATEHEVLAQVPRRARRMNRSVLARSIKEVSR